jgi:hypothetical protein
MARDSLAALALSLEKYTRTVGGDKQKTRESRV